MLVAARTLRGGSLLKPEDLAAKDVLNNDLPADASSDTPEARRSLSGTMVRHSLGAAEIIRRTDVLHPGDHGFLAAVLDPGMRAVTVGVDAVTGSAGLIWPGDRVDLILTQTIGDTAVPMGRRVAAESVLSDARVIAIDQRLVQDADSNTSADHARTVTLEVTPEQAARISVAMRLGKLSLAVRSVEPAVTASPNTIWAADVSAALSGGAAPSPAPPAKVRVFEGAGNIKEYTF